MAIVAKQPHANGLHGAVLCKLPNGESINNPIADIPMP